MSRMMTYKVILNCDKFYDSKDVGSFWNEVIDVALAENYPVIRYKNDFEFDYIPSYLVLDPDLIFIEGVKILHRDKIEQILSDFLD